MPPPPPPPARPEPHHYHQPSDNREDVDNNNGKYIRVEAHIAIPLLLTYAKDYYYSNISDCLFDPWQLKYK